MEGSREKTTHTHLGVAFSPVTFAAHVISFQDGVFVTLDIAARRIKLSAPRIEFRAKQPDLGMGQNKDSPPQEKNKARDPPKRHPPQNKRPLLLVSFNLQPPPPPGLGAWKSSRVERKLAFPSEVLGTLPEASCLPKASPQSATGFTAFFPPEAGLLPNLQKNAKQVIPPLDS